MLVQNRHELNESFLCFSGADVYRLLQRERLRIAPPRKPRVHSTRKRRDASQSGRSISNRRVLDDCTYVTCAESMVLMFMYFNLPRSIRCATAFKFLRRARSRLCLQGIPRRFSMFISTFTQIFIFFEVPPALSPDLFLLPPSALILATPAWKMRCTSSPLLYT